MRVLCQRGEIMNAQEEMKEKCDKLREMLEAAQRRLRAPVNLIKCKGFRELMLKIDETLKETEVG